MSHAYTGTRESKLVVETLPVRIDSLKMTHQQRRLEEKKHPQYTSRFLFTIRSLRKK